MEPIKMWNKKTNSDVEVYNIDTVTKRCLIYNAAIAGQNNGNGWQIVSVNGLIPYPHAEIYKIPTMTKTIYAKAKSKLKLVDATWEATDGVLFDHEHIKDAVEYQMKLDKGDINAE